MIVLKLINQYQNINQIINKIYHLEQQQVHLGQQVHFSIKTFSKIKKQNKVIFLIHSIEVLFLKNKGTH